MFKDDVVDNGPHEPVVVQGGSSPSQEETSAALLKNASFH
jgi:hypothetical protein